MNESLCKGENAENTNRLVSIRDTNRLERNIQADSGHQHGRSKDLHDLCGTKGRNGVWYEDYES